MGDQLDPGVVTLTKAIRQVESNGNFQAKGKTGEYGAYQFMGPTWNAMSSKFGINVPLEQATPQQQNEVAYKQIKEWKDAGHNVGQIASMWNAGPGNPDAYLNGNKGTNSKGVGFDTGLYAQRVATTYQQLKGVDPSTLPTNSSTVPPAPQQEDPASIGGFAGNLVKSGANFLGNTANALIHPIQTVQGIGSIAAGGLQELGGQTTDNTQNFDAAKNFFAQRYGGVDKVLHTAYTDPIGLAADLSALFSGGAGALGAIGKGAELAGAADVANVARSAASTANKLSSVVNPLTPVIAGAGKLISKSGPLTSEVGSQLTGFEPRTIDAIISHPEQFSPEQIATASRTTVAKQVEEALQARIAHLDETGGGYDALRAAVKTPAGFENLTHVPSANDIPVVSNFLENELRTAAKVEVTDGQVVAKGSSVIRDAKDVRAAQTLLNTWKPEFQKGYLTPEEFLNFRTDLAKLAKFEREFSSSKPLEGVAASIRSSLNKDYRGGVPGLQELDTQFAAEKTSLEELRKGLIDKNGDLLDTAINRIANAVGKGKDEQLARLEQLSPGITKKLEILKAMEDIQKAGGTKVGTYPSAFLKAGGVIAGIATGNVPLAATAAATMIIASPGIAVPLLRLFGNEKGFTAAVMAHLAKYVTLGAASSNAVTNSAPQTLPDTQTQTPSSPSPTSTSLQAPAPLQQNLGIPSANPTTSLEQLAKQKTFDLEGARNAGYTDEEISAFLTK